jgi:hypothetical protein
MGSGIFEIIPSHWALAGFAPGREDTNRPAYTVDELSEEFWHTQQFVLFRRGVKHSPRGIYQAYAWTEYNPKREKGCFLRRWASADMEIVVKLGNWAL